MILSPSLLAFGFFSLLSEEGNCGSCACVQARWVGSAAGSIGGLGSEA